MHLEWGGRVWQFTPELDCGRVVPTGTGNQGKPGKWERIFQSGKSQEILSRLEKSGNFTQNTGKIRRNYTGKLKKILEKSGKFVT